MREGYKQTEVGVIPEDWDIRLLGDISNVSSGGTPSRKIEQYWNGNLPWVTTTLILTIRANEDRHHFIRYGRRNRSPGKQTGKI